MYSSTNEVRGCNNSYNIENKTIVNIENETIVTKQGFLRIYSYTGKCVSINIIMIERRSFLLG